MQPYILFFDIDGTIVDGFNGGKKEITEPLREAFRQLKQQGHLCFIATGRPYAYLNDDIMSIEFDGYVLCNGAIILKDGKIFRESLIPKDVVKNLVKEMDQNGNYYFLNYIEEVYFSKNGAKENELFGNEVIKNGKIYYDYDLDKIKVSKIEINNLNHQTIQYVKELEKQGYEIVWYPKINYAEITVPHATKGESIQKVLELLEIPKERSIAFGDGDNDIAMLQVVGHGVAMGNSTEALKAVADVITDTCANDGVVLELQRLGLVKKII